MFPHGSPTAPGGGLWWPVEDHTTPSARSGRLCAVCPHPPPADLVPPDASGWRTEVGRFRASQPRRRFPLGVHVGVPLGPRVETQVPWPVPRGYDAGLRFDLVAALVGVWAEDTGAAAFGWLTRPGVPLLHDCDLDWLAATTRAFGAHDVGLLGFVALTRTGWIDVRSGERRVWKRLRL